MKKSIKIFLILFLLISIITPLIIHILFRIESPEDSFLIAKWEIGDILAYCGSILGSLIIVITVWFTIKSSNDDTRKTIESDQKQFSINLAISSIMEYADALSYSNFDKIFLTNSCNAAKAKYEDAQDDIYSLLSKIVESKNKVFFHLSENEIKYLELHAKQIKEPENLLNSAFSIFYDILTLKEKQKNKKITPEKFEEEYNKSIKTYTRLLDNLDKIVNDAHKQLLDNLKIIINERLKEDRINQGQLFF